MGGAISAVMSGILMKKVEKDLAALIQNCTNLTLIDESIANKKENGSNNELFENMNPRQENVKLIAKTNPTKFINTAINVNPEVP